MNTQDAMLELIQAEMPPLRQPGDLERGEIEEYLSNNGYVLTSRNQLYELLSQLGFESVQVWDNARKGPVRVWRLISESDAEVK